jgi:hypothetical protein
MRTVLAATLIAAVTIAVPAAQLNKAGPESFTAFDADSSTMANGARTGAVEIVINGWSTDADADRLLAVLKNKGQDVLLAELTKLPKLGYIMKPGSVPYHLYFARQRPEADGGRMVCLMTDRYIGGWESRDRPRTIDYPFTLLQLHLDGSGNGEGKASMYTRITQGRDGTIELDQFAKQPVALTEVKKVK